MTMRNVQKVLLALLAVAGCSDDFAPYSRLDTLRVLAMRSQPATPSPGTTAGLTALTFAPAGEIPSMHWSWCPIQAPAADQFFCPLDQATAAAVFAPVLDVTAGGTLPSFDLGTSETALFTNPFSTDALSALCAGGIDSPALSRGFDCDGGYPVTVVLEVATTTDALRAGFVLRLPVGAAPEVNENPSIAGMSLGGTPLAEPLAGVKISPGQEIDLGIEVSPAVAEPRPIPPSEGEPGVRLERLTASWFASTGTIEKTRTSFIDQTTSLTELSKNLFTAPTAEAWPPDGLADFAVVLRDDRGGSAWITRKVMLEQAP